MNKILSICIPVYNKWNFTKSTLNDLSRLPNSHQLIIVDNASSDETQKQLESSKEIIYYRNDVNLGFSKACNIAYSLSTSDNVLFLNNDIRVQSNNHNWTAELINHCHEGLVGPTMGQLDSNFNFIQEANKVLPGISYMSGWCLASSKNIFDKLKVNNYCGPFSEEYFVYYEDAHLSLMARELNIAMKVVQVPAVHFGKISSKQLNTYDLYQKSKNIFVKNWKNRIKMLDLK